MRQPHKDQPCSGVVGPGIQAGAWPQHLGLAQNNVQRNSAPSAIGTSGTKEKMPGTYVPKCSVQQNYPFPPSPWELLLARNQFYLFKDRVFQGSLIYSSMNINIIKTSHKTMF